MSRNLYLGYVIPNIEHCNDLQLKKARIIEEQTVSISLEVES